MSNKNTVREFVLTTTENLADEIIFKTANTLLEETLKSIPFASVITGSIDSYTRFRTLKEQKQLLAFIQEAENINHGFIEKFFNDKSNTELGLEILGILHQTYLEHQARMIGRASVLFKNLSISKQEFDKYTYIITRLNSYLIHLVEKLYSIETNRDDPEFEYDIKNPNMELINFGFLVEVSSPLYPGSTQTSQFKKTSDFDYFYDNIFKD